MPLHGHIFTAPDGIRGFDANQPISLSAAAAFREHGYRFCLRYVRRSQVNKHDLSTDEAQGILDAGLALMPVQHVESEKKWIPTPANGTAYGRTGAADCVKIGIPPGVTVWCDLEGVAPGTPAQDVIDYCNNWHAAVAAAGYVPGLYVGWRAGLSASQLYKSLRFTHYWGAYNLNADEVPIVRKLQMKQAVRKPADKVPGFNVDFQTDTIRTDALGGRPAVVAPEGWPG
jgi:hypothetical protein